MSKRDSTWATRVVIGVAILTGALSFFRLSLVHALSIRNTRERPVQLDCGHLVSVTLRSGESRNLPYSIVGRSFSCVVRSGNDATTCARSLRGMEDVYIAVASDGKIDCDDY